MATELMSFTSKPYIGEYDMERAIDLLLKTRTHTPVERHPTIWRLRQLLNLRLWEPGRDSLLWEDAAGNLLGFAFLYRQSSEDSLLGLGWMIHPQARATPLPASMLDWAQARAREIAQEQQKMVSLNLAVYEDEGEKRTLLESSGFVLMRDIYNWYMTCALDEPLAEPVLPEGFTIRPLTGEVEKEVERYELIYGFPPVKRPYRLALLRDPDYRHQVVVAPDSAFVAYCELSINRREWALSRRRVGWIDYVGTHQDFRRRGLGKAMAQAGLRQLWLWGADIAVLTTLNSNTPAQKTFLASGFHYSERDFCYTKAITPILSS